MSVDKTLPELLTSRTNDGSHTSYNPPAFTTPERSTNDTREANDRGWHGAQEQAARAQAEPEAPEQADRKVEKEEQAGRGEAKKEEVMQGGAGGAAEGTGAATAGKTEQDAKSNADGAGGDAQGTQSKSVEQLENELEEAEDRQRAELKRLKAHVEKRQQELREQEAELRKQEARHLRSAKPSKTDGGTDEEETLQEIKAKTMYDMVEDVGEELGSGDARLIFLTNLQARWLAGNDSSLQTMLDTLEISTEGPDAPKLLINLLISKGFSNHLNSHWPDDGHEKPNPPTGQKRVRPAFSVEDEEHRAEKRLDAFMADVLIPLAARTNAIIIVNAFTCNCVLAQSFNRMVALQKSTWGNKLPFTILAMTDHVDRLYMNKNPDSYWKKVQGASKTWRKRHKDLQSKFEQLRKGSHDDTLETCHDLSKHLKFLILIEGLAGNDKSIATTRDPTAFHYFNTQLDRFLSSWLPSVALQTGALDQITGLDEAVALVNAKTPLMFLDMRKRQSVELGWPARTRVHTRMHACMPHITSTRMYLQHAVYACKDD